MSIPQLSRRPSTPLHPPIRSLFTWLLLAVCAIAPVSAAERYAFTTLAGAPSSGSADGVGTAARFFQPAGVAVDSAGTIYVADYGNATIRKITPTGVVTTLAGLAGNRGQADGAGAAARFSYVSSIAVDAAGNIYVTDYSLIRKITAAGVVTTLAGSFYGSADGTGTAAQFSFLSGIAVDAVGTIYVADTNNHTIRRITPAGVVSTVAGTAGIEGSADGVGTAAQFNRPVGVVVDAVGNVYVSDGGNSTIRAIAPDGTVTTLAGLAGNFSNLDGTGPAARFGTPAGIAFDGVDTLYVADYSFNTIRAVTLAGVVSTLVPSGAGLEFPQGVAVDGAGTVYIADTNTQDIKQITISGGPFHTFAGFDENNFVDGIGSVARFKRPQTLAVDHMGTLYVADTFNSAIRKITAAGVVTTLAPGAGFAYPEGVAVDMDGVVYVADTLGQTIRKIAPNGTVTTLAGLAFTSGSADGVGSDARFNQPAGIAVDASGTIYVVDRSNHTIRTITPAGVVATLAGLAGNPGYVDSADGASARFFNPIGIAVDSAGIVYVADTFNNAIRTITAAGVVGTLAGGSFGANDGIGALAMFSNPSAVAVRADGTVFVADSGSSLIRRITPAGVVTTVGGFLYNSGTADGTGSAARFYQPSGITIDDAGTLYVADTNNNTIRVGTPVPSTGITGHVSNATTATPLAGVYIYVFDATGAFATYTQTDGFGNYSVDDLTPGTYYVRTYNALGLFDQLFDNKPCAGGCNVTLGTAIVVPLGTTKTADFALSPGGQIAGHVKSAVTGTALGSVAIFVFDATGVFATSGYTNESGDYTTFSPIPVGTYYARTSAPPGLDNQLYQNLPCLGGCNALNGTPITVSAGVTTGIDFALSPPPSSFGHIVGRVVDVNTGSAIANVTVTAYDATGTAVAAAVTDATGTYASSALSDGAYFARTSNAGIYSDQLYRGISCVLGCNVTNGSAIAVSSGISTPAVDFLLMPKVGFGGTVTDSDSHPIAGITIALYNMFGAPVQQAVTDPTGAYRFPDLLPQPYFARTQNAAGYLDLLYDHIACSLGCDVTTGNAISVAAYSPMGPVDFKLFPNTPAGSSVVVIPVDQNGAAPVTVTYASVEVENRTTLTMLSTWPTPLQSGYMLGTPPMVFDLSLVITPPSVTPPIAVCVKYAPAAFANPNLIRLLHYENATWVDVTTTLNQTLGVVCGTVSSLSPFAVTETLTAIGPDTTPPVISIASPAANASYAVDQLVAVSYTCTDEVSLASCVGPVVSGGQLNTSSAGTFTFTVTALDSAGNSATSSVSYSVLEGPSITVTSPTEPIYERGSALYAQYVCGNALTCIGDVPNGSLLDTSTPGLKSFTITANDAAGNVTTALVTYTVSLGVCVTPFQGMTVWLAGDGSATDTISGTPATWTGTEMYAAGEAAQAFVVGNGNYVSLPFQQTGDFTLQAWVRTSNRLQPEFTGVLSTGLPGQPATTLQIELDGAGNYRLNAGNSNVSWLIGPAADVFQHVAATFDGTTIAVYLNGQLVQRDVWLGSPGLGFQILNVGIDRDGMLPFTGLVDEVQVFNRALTPDEVMQAFEAGADGSCKNQPPVAIAIASPNPAEVTGAYGAFVTLDGSGSSDPDGDALTYTWREGTTLLGNAPTLSLVFALGSHAITLGVSDGQRHVSTSDVTLVVRDTTPPFAFGMSDLTLEAAGPSGAAAFWTIPNAFDLLDGFVPVSCTRDSGSTFPLGTTDVTCSASDAHNNTTSATFHVTVTDRTAPALTLPPIVNAEATGPDGAAVSFDATANDTVDGTRPVVCVPASGSTFALGLSFVTCTSTDAHSNTTSGSFAVFVRDTTPPTLVLPGLVTAEATSPLGAAVIYSASATDAVSGATLSCSPASGSGFAMGSTAVTCSAYDGASNFATGGFTVVVRDTTAPTVQFTSPAPDALLAGSSVDVIVQTADVIGVAGVTVNGIAMTWMSGTAQAGTWRAAVPIALPLAPGTALHFDARATDASGNVGLVTLVVDNDGIQSALDRGRTDGADQSGSSSNDFNNGVTAGTVTRNGWTTRVSSAPTAGGVRAAVSGAGAIARISACVGVPKEVRLDAVGETADLTCNPATGTITVKAISAVPQIELREQLTSGAWQQFNLRTGQLMSVGSPATASESNETPIAAQLLQIDSAGHETVIGGYQLAPGASVDVSATPGEPGREAQIRFVVLAGAVPVTLHGVTRTIQPGEPTTLPMDRKPPVVTISSPSRDAIYVLNQLSAAACRCEDRGAGLASCDGTSLSGRPIPTGLVGPAAFWVTATDTSGNAIAESVPYAVTYKILPLYDQKKTSRRGSTVPVTLRIADASGINQSAESIALRAQSVSGGERQRGDFRYDADLGGYVFNVKTAGFAAGTYELVFLVSGDPIQHTVAFRIE